MPIPNLQETSSFLLVNIYRYEKIQSETQFHLYFVDNGFLSQIVKRLPIHVKKN